MTDESVQEFRVQRWGEVQVLHFLVQAILDPVDVERVDQTLDKMLSEDEQPRVLLDLGPLEHISSMMLAAIVKALQVTQKKNGRLILARANPRLQQLLEAVRLLELFEIHDTVEGGVKALQE